MEPDFGHANRGRGSARGSNALVMGVEVQWHDWPLSRGCMCFPAAPWFPRFPRRQRILPDWRGVLYRAGSQHVIECRSFLFESSSWGGSCRPEDLVKDAGVPTARWRPARLVSCFAVRDLIKAPGRTPGTIDDTIARKLKCAPMLITS
jgi:hypothetical protein